MSEMEKSKVSLLDLIITVLERKWFFFWSMLIFSVVGVVVSFILPKEYKATTKIMKPQNKLSGGLGDLSSIVGDFPLSGMLKSLDLLNAGDVDSYLSVLETEKLALGVCDSFNLVKYYKMDENDSYFREDLLYAFHNDYSFEEDDYGNVSISIINKNPDVAAAMSSYVVYLLDSITYAIGKDNARNSRLFFEKRLEIMADTLKKAHEKFARFKIDNKYLDLDQQVEATISALAQLEAEQLMLDVKIEQMLKRYGKGYKQIQGLKKDRAVIQDKISQYVKKGNGELVVALKDVPEKAIEYGQLYRDVKVQEMLNVFLLQMHEQAKFDEVNNIPVVQVLQEAVPPQKRHRPKRKLICYIFFFLGFSVTMTVILVQKWYIVNKENATESYLKVKNIKEMLLLKK